MRLCTNGKTVTATYLQRSAIYYNAGTAWLPQTNQVGGTAIGNSYCTKLVNALDHTHFAANASGTVIEYADSGITNFNAYNTTTLFNPPGGCYHAAEASQWYIWNYSQGSWINHTGASAASLDFSKFSPYTTGNTLVFFANWQDYKANVTYNVNGGSITTGTGTTRYRVSGSTVQVSTNSGSSWSNLTYSFGARTTYPDHWNVGTYGATRTGYYITGTEAYGTTAAGGTLINQDYSSSNTTNAATAYRMNGNANLTANKNFTLYIHWKPYTYTITFNRNGGPPNGTDSATATYGSAMPSATMPTRAGYTFNGYYDAASGGTQYYTAAGASARAWNKTANTTLYAQWTKNNYTLTLNLNKTNVSGSTEVNVTDAYYKILPSKTVGSPSNDISNWSKFRLSQNAWLAQHKDGYFASGNNNISRYSYGDWSSWDTSSTVTRIAKQSDNPFSNATYEIQVDVRTPERAPDDFDGQAGGPYAGWVQTTQSAANLSFQHIFVAKIPLGSKIGWSSNSTGDGSTVTWLTPRDGTGDYQVYAYQRNCGSTGTFGTFGFVYIITDVTTVQTIYIAYSEVFNVTQSQTFSIAYAAVTSDLPVPYRPGYKFMGWGRSYNGSEFVKFGRDRMHTAKINVRVKAYMDDWSQYVSGNSGSGMRMISCTEGGGWNIESSNGYVCFQIYKNGTGYNGVIAPTKFADLEPGWHIFDILFDGTQVIGYIDGISQGTVSWGSGSAIGYSTTNGVFAGAEAEGNETTASSYRFTGWMVAPLIWSGDHTVSLENTQMTMPAENYTLKAYWERSNHINVFHNGTWNDVPINIYHNGEWQPSVIQTYHNGTWEET